MAMKRMHLRHNFILAALALLFCPALLGCSGGTDLSIHIPKIGAADCIILQQGDYAMVIDTGEEDDGEEILGLFKEKEIRQLDALILTHFDKDHIGSVEAVLEAVDVKQIYLPSYEKDSKLYRKAVSALENCSGTVHYLTADTDFSLGEMDVSISVPKAISDPTNDNDHSLVIRLSYGEKRFLFAGDSEAERLSELLAEGDLSCHVLKVPHHGRYNENTEAFLEACGAEKAIITDSDKSPGEAVVINLLMQHGADVYQTRNGDVRIVTNGTNLAVHQD